MTKANYAAWALDPAEYDPTWDDGRKLRFASRFAVLAPSGHNVQPWHFEFGSGAVFVSQERSRSLGYSGAEAGEPHLSLGACAESLRMAALGFGLALSIDYDSSGTPVAEVLLGEEVEGDISLPKAIIDRVSNRSPYQRTPVSESVLAKVTENDLRLALPRLITDADDVSFMAEQTAIATRRIVSRPEFRAELSEWVRSNTTSRFDGMPGFVQGMPTVPSMVAKHVIRRLDISKGQAQADAERVKNSAALVLLTIREESPNAMFDAGRLYARICIQAQQQGLATSAVVASVVDPESRKRIVEHFGLADRPVVLLRVGFATKPARHTPRWPLEAVASAPS